MQEILRTIDQNKGVFQYYNANPYGNNTNDCVIRSICGVTGKEWEEVLMELTLCAMKHKLMIDDPDLYTKYLKENGWTKHNQPKKKCGKKYKAYEWAPIFKGKAIAHVGAHHMVMVSHGKVWDTWYSLDGIVGNYWTKD